MAFNSSPFYDQDSRLSQNGSYTLWAVLKALLVLLVILLTLMFSSCGSSKRVELRERVSERDSIRYSLSRLDSVHIQHLRSDTTFSRVLSLDSLTCDVVTTEEIWNVETETTTTDSLGRPVRHLQRQTHTLKHRKERKQQHIKRDSIGQKHSTDNLSLDSIRNLTSDLTGTVHKTSDKISKQKERLEPSISFMDRVWLKVTHHIGWIFLLTTLVILVGINLKKIRPHFFSCLKWLKRLLP